jgi:hypothetical protein
MGGFREAEKGADRAGEPVLEWIGKERRLSCEVRWMNKLRDSRPLIYGRSR